MGQFINKTFDYKINNDIRGYQEIRLIYKEHSLEDSPNDFNKIVSLDEAKRISLSMSLDLIEVNSKTYPPIVRLCEYSKFLWEQKKKNKSKSKNNSILKEIQLKANIAENDLETKSKAALKFIDSGYKVKIVLTLKGRELARKEFSKEPFYKLLAMMGNKISYDLAPQEDGNKTYAIIRKKKLT